MSDDMDPMAEIRASFFIECEELLEALQDGLQSLEDGETDSETINVVFRAVHSIKGGAGAFGLENLVRFAHRYETALDEVRGERLAITDEAMRLFFQAADHLSDLVRVSRDDAEVPSERSAELLAQLDVLIGEEEEVEEEIDFQPAAMVLDLDLDIGDPIEDMPSAAITEQSSGAEEVNTPTIEVVFKPFPELFETGNEPFHILRALNEIGHVSTEIVLEDLPTLDTIEPEKPYISWHTSITTHADIAEINSVFEFVEGLCTLEVGPKVQSVSVTKQDTPSGDEPETVEVPIQVPSPQTPATEKPVENLKSERIQETERTPSKRSNPVKSVVRVDLDRIERLVNLVGELVINQAMLSQSLEKSGLSPHSDAMNGLDEFQRLTRDIQDSVMMIRAQPVKSLFQRMSRIVREASAAVNKDVRLITEGENTEVDKTVIERLADPLTHMIRNAVDHGVESKADRQGSGKPAQGTVTLTASHKSGRVIIDVSDDGNGINRQRVFEIAVSKGLISDDVSLTDTEIDNLLFLPGFSTAASVSDLSGRGVGMDVVKTAIQSLGGRITIHSEAGTGTKFSISLPLTLAVLDGMIIEVAGETLVVPLNLIIETLTLSDHQLDQIQPGLMSIRVRGEFVPIFDLGVALGYRNPIQNYQDCVVLLITREDGQRSAILVDEIRDQRQVVIKGLDENFYRSPGIAAATILGDGQIALILDPTDILYETPFQEKTEHGALA